MPARLGSVLIDRCRSAWFLLHAEGAETATKCKLDPNMAFIHRMSANTMPVIVYLAETCARFLSICCCSGTCSGCTLHVKGWSVLEVHAGFVKETLELKPYASCLCAVTFVFPAAWAQVIGKIDGLQNQTRLRNPQSEI